MNTSYQDNVDQPGFSLLEVLIATSVLAIACLGLASSFTSSLRMSEFIRNEGIACNAADQKLAELRMDMAIHPLKDFLSKHGGGSDDEAQELDAYGGESCHVRCFLNEQYVHPEDNLDAIVPGGVLDLDGDGEITDDFATDLSEQGIDALVRRLRLCPVEVSVTYGEVGGKLLTVKRYAILRCPPPPEPLQDSVDD